MLTPYLKSSNFAPFLFSRVGTGKLHHKIWIANSRWKKFFTHDFLDYLRQILGILIFSLPCHLCQVGWHTVRLFFLNFCCFTFRSVTNRSRSWSVKVRNWSTPTTSTLPLSSTKWASWMRCTPRTHTSWDWEGSCSIKPCPSTRAVNRYAPLCI